MINNIIKKANKYISNQEYRLRVNSKLGLYNNMDDKKFIEKMFKATMDYPLNLENPKSFNEKLQWLKLYDRNPLYTKLVDKYKVREYISEKIGEGYLIPLLGVWDDPEDIDFDSLPNKFVLKCNHNSGLGMCICTDKSKIDIKKVKNELKSGLAQNYYLNGREWPYKNVSRKIICEKYMTDETGKNLRDYKFYCFDGKPKIVGIYQDRNSDKETTGDFFDMNFEWVDLRFGMPNALNKPQKPQKFQEMIKIAEILSEGMPEVRVDLYISNNKIYFGELTFFDGGGFDKIEPLEWDYKLGSWIKLPKKMLSNGD
ncbi:MAG: ATP-grasp fold amidoligase family protein [Anaerococcus vaginalis]|nr:MULTISPECIES: ATP-grasp fold amidoligase family protein [Anaerococcus]MDU4378984.1 ATP-grasp fold amidoligase family protein [Anaerococcus vaginalis]MDU5459979.1 ATP-grasp fold amidoligase family protein [Anaerococcus vaginalis]MDU5823636.1 ATP-grasp fold amidoligase family protein [Anaerococcus vaginalis]OFJ67524.1 glycosyl transferase [Anaerococcus sp. HMSC065G05]